MPDGRFVAYYRVSTAKQGKSGLGLDAQKHAVLAHLNGSAWTLSAEFTEVESGKRTHRPQLVAALTLCRLIGATLVIAKLDRLTRNLAFLANLMESGVAFVACDNPHATPFTIHILAAVAQHEREQIIARTKAALAASKARRLAQNLPPLGGYRGGPVPSPAAGAAAKREKADDFARCVMPTIRELRESGLSLHQTAAKLAGKGIMTPRGGAWTATAVRRVLARVEGYKV